MRSRRFRLLLTALAVTATVAPSGRVSADAGYTAEIRRTEFGIPHIKADSWGDAAFGVGYAFAEDNVCVMADVFVTVNAQRSRFFGPDGTYVSEANGVIPRNLDSDFFYEKINRSGVIESLIDGTSAGGSRPVSQTVKDVTRGWVAGYNAYLAEDRITDPACAGAEWVRPVTEMDLYRRFYQLVLFASQGFFLPSIVAAQPPIPDLLVRPQLPDASAFDPRKLPTALGLGSNAYALGSESTEHGRGMLLGNPHFPWFGPERFYEFHVTIPGQVNVMGGALFGSPLVHIGVNDHIAWSHTVSVPFRFTPYELKLVPGDPTAYVYEGRIKRMKTTTVTVEVAPDDVRSHTFYDTDFGPVIDYPDILLPWTPAVAYAIRDANADNFRALDHFVDVNQASSAVEVRDILHRHLGIPWVNTIAADDQGNAFYADISVVPHLTDEQLARCTTATGEALKALARLPVLDGSRRECEWGTDPQAPAKGIYGGPSLPQLFRTDYVANSNDSYWLSNPEQPLEGYPYVMGDERTQRSLRTRIGIRQLQEELDERADVFTLDELQAAVFSNRQYAGELIRDDLVDVCRQTPMILMDDGTLEDVSAACDVLADWDVREDVGSRGAHVFREFMSDALGSTVPLFLVPFDPDDPVNTPRQLNVVSPEVRFALGSAVRRLREAGVALDAELGAVQRATRNDGTIAIHGGPGELGQFNAIYSNWDPSDGVAYPDTQYGSSFVITAEFTDDGPHAQAILTYSLSTDRTSPHFGDQTELYSRKEWVDLLLREDQILSSPALQTYSVSG